MPANFSQATDESPLRSDQPHLFRLRSRRAAHGIHPRALPLGERQVKHRPQPSEPSQANPARPNPARPNRPGLDRPDGVAEGRTA
ncbi:MAG: hypothetical protein ACK56I_22035, partial [bacterium]